MARQKKPVHRVQMTEGKRNKQAAEPPALDMRFNNCYI